MTGRVGRVGLAVTIVLLFGLGVLDLVQHYRVEPVAAFALSAARVAPLLFFRRRPVEAWVIELSAVLVTAIVTVPVSPAEPWPWAVSSIATLTAVAGLVATLGGKHLSIVMVTVTAALGVLLSIWPGRGDWFSFVATTVAVAIGAGVGDVVWARRQMANALAEEKQVSAAERELRSVVEERARIAREMHDVVAHHMSVIVVQSETARYRLDGLPERAVAEFTEIARLARGSLSELRGLLSALRDDGADPARTPQPTLAELPALVARVEAAGIPVTMTIAPGAENLPQVLQLAVFRIVQEGLSNVVRHAPGARTWVDIARRKETLTVEVTNDEAGGGGPLTDKEGGHGLAGVRERVTLLGGRFEVDQPDGGWRLRAVLPL
ncbi:sensor histidine kinase [Actinophytocola sp. NPDC049390]|uniref:sensor histidine kinase n=1 Tax=Actinophytocola sp. NPDC049390 TaxID=3363894 RepID=UPI0037A21EBF